MARFALEINGRKQTIDADPEMPLALGAPRPAQHDRHKIRLRHRALRSLHRSHRRRRNPLLPDPRSQPRPASKSSPSKVLPQMVSIRSRKPGSLNKFRNAAIANPDRSCPPLRLLAQKPHPTDADIDEAMAGNLCRCATYFRIRNAIHRAAGRRTREHQTQPSASRKQAHPLAPHLPRNLRGRRRSPGCRPHPSRPSSPALFRRLP